MPDDTAATFGDWEAADAWALEPPDPEQVAIRLHRLRVQVDELTTSAGLTTWDELDDPERDLAIAIGHTLVDWLRTHRPEPEQAARSLHNVRRYIATSPLPPWEALPADDRAVGVDLMTLVIAWLQRQGALV